jgi:hypothetical protein
MHTDLQINCRECGQRFVLTAAEQAYYALRGASEPPTLCPPCRAARRRPRE